MALQTYTLTGPIGDLTGAPLGRGVRVVIKATEDIIADSSTGGMRMSEEYVADVDPATGGVSVNLPATVDGFPLYRVIIEQPNGSHPRQAGTGYFAMTANRTLAWAVENSVEPAQIDASVVADIAGAVAAVGEVEAIRDETDSIKTDVLAAQAAIEARVVEDLGTTDGQTKALITTPASETAKALSATIATEVIDAKADPYTIQRLDRQGIERARRGAGRAMAEHTDATEKVFDWANLSAVNAATNCQVSGNRVYSVNWNPPGGFTVAFPINLAAGERAHIQTILYWKAGSTAAPVYFGIDCGTAGHPLVAGEPHALAIGLNGAGQKARVIGSAMPTPGAVQSFGSNPTADTAYQLTVDVDDVWVTLMIKKIGAMNDAYYYGIRRDTLTAAGLQPNNIFLYMTDDRNVSGHSLGPMVAHKSLQPARARTVAGYGVEGSDFRLRSTAKGAAEDPQLYALPKSYDPRRPSPVVLFCHQSLTGNERTAFTESRLTPVTQALLNAGYIVAGCNAWGDKYGSSGSVNAYLDLYNHLRDNFNTGPLFLYGASMGGLDIVNIVGRREWPTPAAAAGVGLALTLQSVRNAGEPYATALRETFGVAPDWSDWAEKTAGYRPEARPGWAYRGVPLRLYTSLTEPTQPAAGSEAFKDATAPFGPVSVVYGTGGHLDASQYQAADVVSFFNSFR